MTNYHLSTFKILRKQHIAVFNLPQYYSIKIAVVKVIQARLVVIINRSGFYQVYVS